jgi:hypothetical protein
VYRSFTIYIITNITCQYFFLSIAVDWTSNYRPRGRVCVWSRRRQDLFYLLSIAYWVLFGFIQPFSNSVYIFFQCVGGSLISHDWRNKFEIDLKCLGTRVNTFWLMKWFMIHYRIYLTLYIESSHLSCLSWRNIELAHWCEVSVTSSRVIDTHVYKFTRPVPICHNIDLKRTSMVTMSIWCVKCKSCIIYYNDN